jgi:hypothetical protein
MVVLSVHLCAVVAMVVVMVMVMMMVMVHLCACKKCVCVCTGVVSARCFRAGYGAMGSCGERGEGG